MMSSVVLPSTVEELNYMQSAQSLYIKSDTNNKGFENILVAGGYKREFSLPDGVNWNVYDYETYLNFEDNNNAASQSLKAIEPQDDCIVPGESELRQRSESFSSSMEDNKSLAYQGMGVKTFSTVCVDSGSTCISSEHSYVSPSPPVYRGLDEEETYQNLSTYFKQNPDLNSNDSLSSISPASSPADPSNLEYSVLNNFSSISHCSQDSFQEISVGSKRPAESPDPDSFSPKRGCDPSARYSDSRKKNNISSKNCRKTRKEKQKEMETRVSELEREREQLNSSIEMLEKAIKAHHVHLCSILGSRQQQMVA